MVISLGRSIASADPHIRPMDPRRDGVALADLLETAFRDEPADDEGKAMLRMLRNFGVFDVAMTEGATGFLWIEDGLIVGNASLMRNRARSDTWVVGNVGTHPGFRGRGIATALVTTCMRYAADRGAARVALEVSQSNAAAMRVYDRLGFGVTGLVTHYARPALGAVPLATLYEPPGPMQPRPIGWRESGRVWALSRRNVPIGLTHAEPFSPDDYRPDLKWRIMNAFEGNPVTWISLGARAALRMRVGFDSENALFELMPAADARVDELLAVLSVALARLNPCGRRPIQAHQSRLDDPGNEAAHAALQGLGFSSLRTLAHMLATVTRS
ncbi:MAG: GNAT family N-acetyltransferase [Thermoflexales bacterium]